MRIGAGRSRLAAAAACAALALFPARLASPPAPARTLAEPPCEASALALTPFDLLGPALGVPLGPALEAAAPAPVASAPPAWPPDPLAQAPVFASARSVPEPAGLALLSLASAAAAWRGTRRCLPRRPRR